MPLGPASTSGPASTIPAPAVWPVTSADTPAPNRSSVNPGSSPTGNAPGGTISAAPKIGLPASVTRTSQPARTTNDTSRRASFPARSGTTSSR